MSVKLCRKGEAWRRSPFAPHRGHSADTANMANAMADLLYGTPPYVVRMRDRCVFLPRVPHTTEIWSVRCASALPRRAVTFQKPARRRG